MSFKLLRCAEDWDGYQEAVRERLQREGAPAWNSSEFTNAPALFPCLVDSLFVPPNRIVSCFVYPSTAQAMLAALGLDNLAESPAAPEAARGATDWVGYLRQQTALTLALVQVLVELGITHEQHFERLVALMNSKIDQYMAEKQDGVAFPETVLPRVLPRAAS